MQEQIIRFINALRAEGVRVSLAESLDAFNAIRQLGIVDREGFRYSLRSSVIKERSGLDAFDKLFPHFFGSSPRPVDQALKQSLSDDELRAYQELLDSLATATRQRLDELIDGQPLDENELLGILARTGMENASQKHLEWLARRIEQYLNFESLKEAMAALIDMLSEIQSAERNQEFAGQLQSTIRSWQEQIRHFLVAQFHRRPATRDRAADVAALLDRPFPSLNETERQQLREEVRRLAAALKTRLALRMKRTRKGRPDLRATIRANIKHQGIPISIVHRMRHRKPKIVALCDVSTSMRFCSELMVSLLFHLDDLVSKTHAFAFIDRLVYITPQFEGKSAGTAVSDVLRRIPPGYYSTDLGRCLQELDSTHSSKLDNKTTLIIVGDGRNNYNNPRHDILSKMARRVRRVIWMNPEPETQWETGDSDMRAYQPYCSDILRVSNLRQLSAAINDIKSW